MINLYTYLVFMDRVKLKDEQLHSQAYWMKRYKQELLELEARFKEDGVIL